MAAIPAKPTPALVAVPTLSPAPGARLAVPAQTTHLARDPVAEPATTGA